MTFPSNRSSKYPGDGNTAGVNGRVSLPKETQKERKPDGSINGNKKSIDEDTKPSQFEGNDGNNVIEETKEESKESSKEDITIDLANNNLNRNASNPMVLMSRNSA